MARKDLIYVTYRKFGALKMAVFNEQQYAKLMREKGVEDITVHNTQMLMENFFHTVGGEYNIKNQKKKNILYG